MAKPMPTFVLKSPAVRKAVEFYTHLLEAEELSSHTFLSSSSSDHRLSTALIRVGETHVLITDDPSFKSSSVGAAFLCVPDEANFLEKASRSECTVESSVKDVLRPGLSFHRVTDPYGIQWLVSSSADPTGGFMHDTFIKVLVIHNGRRRGNQLARKLQSLDVSPPSTVVVASPKDAKKVYAERMDFDCIILSLPLLQSLAADFRSILEENLTTIVVVEARMVVSGLKRAVFYRAPLDLVTYADIIKGEGVRMMGNGM